MEITTESTTAKAVPLTELLEFLARALVDSPDQVKVDEFDSDGTLVLELSVAEPDLGKVIGKQGRTANALRTIIRASGVKRGQHATVEIIDD